MRRSVVVALAGAFVVAASAVAYSRASAVFVERIFVTDKAGTTRIELCVIDDAPTLVLSGADGKFVRAVRLDRLRSEDAGETVKDPHEGRRPAAPGQPIFRASGTGHRSTEEFTAPKKWRIVWTNRGGPETRIFAVGVCRDGRPVLTPVSFASGVSGEAYVYEGGTFSLDVTGTGEWSVEVYSVE